MVLLAVWRSGLAQVNVTPYAGINSTGIYDGVMYEKGGTFLVAGVELELGIKRKPSQRTYFSLATGANYLKNGFYYSGNFSYAALDFYTQRTTDLSTAYVQIPLTLRFNWQPFPLIEDWKVFLGIGLCHTTLTKSTLEEKYTEVTYGDDPLVPPQVVSYQDSRDVTDYGDKRSLFRRIEVGMKYKRLQVTSRFGVSITDLYRTGLEDEWNIPDDMSWYLSAYQDSGKIIERTKEVVVGFRFGTR